VNRQRSTRGPNAIDVKGMDTLPASAQTKTLLVKVPIEDIEEDDDVEVAVCNMMMTRMPLPRSEFIGCIRTVRAMNLTPSVDRARLE